VNAAADNPTSAGALKSRRVFYLIFATATLLILGLIYAWSIFASPIGKTYPSYGPLLPQVFQVSMFSFCVSALFGAQIIKRASARLAIIIAAILLGGGFVLTAFASGLGAWALFLFYGVCAAAGCGIAYNAIIALVNPWFPDKIGLCSGVQMMGFGVSSLVFGSVANAMFGVMDWSLVFVLIAIAGMAVMILLAFVVRPAPADVAARLGLKGAAAATKAGPTKSQSILQSKVFWVYAIWATAVIACGLTVIGTAKQGAEALGFEPGFAALLVGLVSTMNGVSRIVNGAIFDKFGLVPVMTLSAALSILTMTGMAFSFAAEIQGLYVVAAVLTAMPYGSVPVMASAYARQRYSAADFAKNLGITNCCIALAAAVNIAIVTFGGSPVGAEAPLVYAVLAVLAAAAFLAVFLFKKIYTADLARIAEEAENV
jgi:OFA family oxalate/formate antiporter-like MFS transporter